MVGQPSKEALEYADVVGFCPVLPFLLVYLDKHGFNVLLAQVSQIQVKIRRQVPDKVGNPGKARVADRLALLEIDVIRRYLLQLRLRMIVPYFPYFVLEGDPPVFHVFAIDRVLFKDGAMVTSIIAPARFELASAGPEPAILDH